MKLKVKNIQGIYTNENETNLSSEVSKVLTGNLNRSFNEASDYIEKCKSDDTHDYFQEIVLDEDKLNTVKKDSEFKNEYIYDPEYYFLGINGNTLSVYKENITTLHQKIKIEE